MNLILWRHAEAEDGWPDLERALTPHGLIQANLMANWLKPFLPHDATILVSPARRTQQTAQALNLPFITHQALAPDQRASEILAAAEWPNKKGTVIIVGHQPTLGEIISLQLTGNKDHWTVKKGSIWWLEQRSSGNTEVVAVMTPSLLGNI